MRFEDGHWVCRWCGSVLDIPVDKQLVEAEREASTAGCIRRVITVDGQRVHSCELPEAVRTGAYP